MDGTLTVPVHDFVAIRDELGLPKDKLILEALDDMPADKASPIRARLEEIEFSIADQAIAQDGAEDLLEQLLSRQKKVGILTRNGEDIAHRTLKACGLDHFFELPLVVGRETCLPKPAPDGVNHLLSIWNVCPQKRFEQSVMVGDYQLDIEAGYSAGIKTVYLDNSRSGTSSDLANLSISSLNELAAYVT